MSLSIHSHPEGPTDRPVDTLGPLLTWSQLHDTAFPSGRFVHSHGLEAWTRAHPDAGPGDIADVAWSFLAASVAPLDGVACAHAWTLTEPADLTRLDELVAAQKISASSRKSSTACGTQLAVTATSVLGELVSSPYLDGVVAQRSPGNTAVVEGHLQRSIGIPQHAAVAAHLQSTIAGFLSAAVRLGRVGPVWVQREIYARRAQLVHLAAGAISTPVDDMHSAACELEIYAMTHETARGRQFTT